MQSSRLIKVMLLFSAYLPLFIVIAVEHAMWLLPKVTVKKRLFCDELHAIFADPKFLLSFLSMLMMMVSVVSCLFIVTYVRDTVHSRNAPTRVKVASIKVREQDVLAYLVTYVLPLFTLSSTTWRDAIALLFTLFLIFWLSLRTDMLFVNPLFLLMKYHIYSVDTTNGEMLLLSHLDKAKI